MRPNILYELSKHIDALEKYREGREKLLSSPFNEPLDLSFYIIEDEYISLLLDKIYNEECQNLVRIFLRRDDKLSPYTYIDRNGQEFSIQTKEDLLEVCERIIYNKNKCKPGDLIKYVGDEELSYLKKGDFGKVIYRSGDSFTCMFSDIAIVPVEDIELVRKGRCWKN